MDFMHALYMYNVHALDSACILPINLSIDF